MTYRDRTFCTAHCLNFHCPKNWDRERLRYLGTPEHRRGDVSLADLSDGCPDYQPAREALAE